uniref:Protein SYS1 homolog n=1 Tax=Lynceus sp. MCZ IZ 141354 TaxID=1930659 RepID=A0A9N6WUH7_9CRUS|nr:EOG090X0FH3 [Lynceus sp. MCZ IZ 141354]
MGGSFRTNVWDPVLIVSQIAALQCVMYLSLGFWTVVLHLITGQHLSLDYFFKYQEVGVKDISGRLVISSFILNSIICSLALWTLVQRTKLCLDFTVTAHFVHVIICFFYNSALATNASWWVLQLVCVVITCVLGEFLCLRSEMKAIPLGLTSRVDL